jgi:predicted N-acetyltransferase YhbS
MASRTENAVLLRTATPEDAAACGRICFDAFSAINHKHGFPCDFPAPEVAIAVLTMLFSNPDFHAIVAERDGRILGSNCLDERSSIFGVGPITVDPAVQNSGVGRRLMEAAMQRAENRGAAGVRLVQAAFHTRSLALYASLGFEVRELLCCMQGQSLQREIPQCEVRPATAEDADACCALALRVHGFERRRELAEGVERRTAVVVERGGRITGYASSMGFFGHATAGTNLDLMAMIASANSLGGPGILVPARDSLLLQWGLADGLRIVQPMTLMTTGIYQEPAGAWLSSVFF